MISPTLTRTHPYELERGATISLVAHWHRIVLAAIVAIAVALNFIGLSSEGYDNQYYAAAVKSMSLSWHNFFFNSFDPGGFVTIDKPPLGFWFQVASVKVFGYSGIAMLLPQALAGVLAVVLLYWLVARTFGRSAGLIAGLALAVTPISVVTARNNTIDSTLVVFLLFAAWAVTKAAETGRVRWLMTGAVLVGLGFNIKMLEAYLVVPAFGLMYLLSAKATVLRRLIHLALASVVLVGVSLSWATAVDLTSAAGRPWVDSTTTNSEINLAIGYNGLQRLTGSHSVSNGSTTTRTSATSTTKSRSTASTSSGGFGGNAGGGPGGVGENGPTGVLRLVDVQLGSQIGWMLPLAVVGFVVGLFAVRPRLRDIDDRQRSVVLWGAWLATTGIFFSVALFFHTYYLVMVAPAVCALTGIGIVGLWQVYRRPESKVWFLLPLTLLGAAAMQAYILRSYPSWSSWLTPIVLVGSSLAALGLIVFRLRPFANPRGSLVAIVIAVPALLAPSAAFANYTMQHTATGAILRAGPSANGASNAFGGPSGGPPTGFGAQGSRPTGNFVPPPGAPGAAGNGAPTTGAGAPAGQSRIAGGSNFGGFGGDTANATLVKYLEKHQGSAMYLAATTNSNSAAPLIIATGKPVMSLGGFSGSDPILTTAKLAALAKAGVVRYFLINGGGPGGPGGSNDLTPWIQAHSKLLTLGGTQIYKYTG